MRDLVTTLRSEAARVAPGLVNGARDDPLELRGPTARRRLALRAANGLGGEGVAVHDELGVVRLLLASQGDGDLRSFVNEVVGPSSTTIAGTAATS